MGKLIDEAAALTALDHTPYWQAEDKFRSKQAVRACPSVDAVPVIRCKDCKGCRKRNLGIPKEAIYKAGTKWCIVFEAPVHDDGFCSWAEPKEETRGKDIN